MCTREYNNGSRKQLQRGRSPSAHLVACFHMIGIILNGYAVAVPEEEDFDGDQTETVSAAQQRRRA